MCPDLPDHCGSVRVRRRRSRRGPRHPMTCRLSTEWPAMSRLAAAVALTGPDTRWSSNGPRPCAIPGPGRDRGYPLWSTRLPVGCPCWTRRPTGRQPPGRALRAGSAHTRTRRSGWCRTQPRDRWPSPPGRLSVRTCWPTRGGPRWGVSAGLCRGRTRLPSGPGRAVGWTTLLSRRWFGWPRRWSPSRAVPPTSLLHRQPAAGGLTEQLYCWLPGFWRHAYET